MNPKKFFIQFFINNKEPMEVSERLVSEKFIDDVRGIPLVDLEDFFEDMTFRIWNYHDNRDSIIYNYEYSPYTGKIGFKYKRMIKNENT